MKQLVTIICAIGCVSAWHCQRKSLPSSICLKMSPNAVLDHICSDLPHSWRKRERVRKTVWECVGIVMKIEMVGEPVRKRESDRERRGGRWWHVDLWAAGLFINHTEFYWNTQRRIGSKTEPKSKRNGQTAKCKTGGTLRENEEGTGKKQ